MSMLDPSKLDTLPIALDSQTMTARILEAADNMQVQAVSGCDNAFHFT